MNKVEYSEILTFTGLDQKIKLKHFENTWEFTRFKSMVFKMAEVFFYMILSNTENIIYLSMMLSIL